MPNTISLDDWLRVLDAEYLSTFVRDGGASIKFAVTPERLRADLSTALAARCRELDYVFVELDAATMRAHMPQDIFFKLAGQLDWRLLARRVLLRLAGERGYQVAGIDPGGAVNVFDAVAATVHGLESQSVMNEIRPGIQNDVAKDLNMAKDFRVAMSYLCLNENTRNGGKYEGQPLLDWLTGANTRISSVRPFTIYTAINRTTARYFIESALYWIRHAGCAGTVILLDNSRVTLARNPKDGLRYYSRAMAVDHYELLREFVDGVDRLTGALMVVATSQDFLDEGPKSRGYGIYPALRTRVMDDVRDRNLVNPIASLMRFS